MALTAEGRVLVIGGLDGKVETRNLDAEAAILRDRAWTVSANRGKVVQIDGNRARRRLLVLTDDFKAQLWDLKNRTCRRLPGSWSSAVFLDDDNLALTASADAPQEAGKVVRVRHDPDRARFEPRPPLLHADLRHVQGPRAPGLRGADPLARRLPSRRDRGRARSSPSSASGTRRRAR